MAVGHEVGGNKQSSEPSEGENMHKLPSSKVSNPDNIDTLVSRFLDELSDISSGIAHDGDTAANSGIEAEAGNDEASIPLRLPEEAVPAADSELERINEEIEKSLAELESLKPEPVTLEHSSVPEVKAQPTAAAELPPTEAKITPVESPAPVDSEEQAWNLGQLFTAGVAESRKRRRQMIGWILAGAGLIVILGVAGFHFFSSSKSTPEGVVQIHNDEPAKPAQTPGDIQNPGAAEKSSALTPPPKSGRPADAAKPAVQETRAKPTSSSNRNANTGSNRTPGTSAAGQKPTRQGQNGNGAVPAEKPRTSEESPRPVSTQAAAATTAPPEQPSAAANPPASASQPKPNPVTPSGAPDNSSANIAVPPVAASIPEPTPAAPKAAPAANMESGNAVSQPKARTAVMAEVVSRVQPVYPTIARSRRIVGKVDVDVEVNEKGDVIRAKAVSGPDLFRPSAEQALMKWKFKPASIDGVSVPSKARISVNFNVQP